MARSEVFVVQYADDESWRMELCPDCGARLFSFAAWKDHGPRHRWGSDWFAARVRAGRRGEIMRVIPTVLGGASSLLAIDDGQELTWMVGITAWFSITDGCLGV